MNTHRSIFTFVVLSLMLALSSATTHAQEVSVDIQAAADGVSSTTTEISGAAGGTIVIELFASGWDQTQGVNASFTISNPDAVANIAGTHQITGFSFPPTPIQGWSAGSATFSYQSGGLSRATEPAGDGLKIVGQITLTIADTFTPFDITLNQVEISITPAAILTPGTVLKVTQPANNLISNVAVVRSHNKGTISWTTLFAGTNDVVTYNVSGSTSTSTAMGTLAAESTAHAVALTGLTAGTTYEYSIASTSTSGEISPSTTGSFTTRLAPDTRPAEISGVNAQTTTNTATISWTSNRPGDTRHKIYAYDNTTSTRGDLVVEGQTTPTEGVTSHRVDLTGLTGGTFYQYEASTRLIGLDDLVTEGSMTEAQLTATQTKIFKTKNALPPVSLTRSPRVTRGTDNARVVVRANQPVTVSIDYGARGTTRPTGAVPTGSDFTSDPFYPNRVSSTSAAETHTIDLTGLEGSTRYRYRVNLTPASGEGSFTTDPRGTGRFTRDLRFRTLATVAAPAITRGPAVRARRTRAWVSVATNVATTATLFYGTAATINTADEFEVPGRLTTTVHSWRITGLTPETQYKFRIKLTNLNGQSITWPATSSKPAAAKLQLVGSDGGFGTPNVADTQNPLITRVPTVIAASDASLTIAWETDEPSTSSVSFGTSADNLDNLVSSGETAVKHQVVLTGLTAGTQYAFRVDATDLDDNGPTQSAVAFGTTLTGADITAPTITSAPALLYASDTVAEIQLTTDELSSGELNYGTSADNLDQSLELNGATTHVSSLTGLTAGTTYFYQAVMTDESGNGPTSSEVLSFTTAAAADATPPVISAVTVTPLETSAVVTWTTDEIASGNVQFGTDATALTGNAGDDDAVTSHSIVVPNLTAGTEYTYVVQAVDRSGNGPAQTEQATFTTVAAGAATAPAAPEGVAARAGNGTIVLSWNAPPADATGLVLERAVGEGDFTPLATLDAITAFTDNTVVNDTAYRYQVRSQGLIGLGTPSTAAEATPSATAGPSAPTLSAIQGEPLTPTLIVNNSTPQNEGDTLTYTFQVSTMSDYSDIVEVATVASGTGTTSHTLVRELIDKTQYFYRIKANDGFSDSPFLTGDFTINASAPAYPGDLNGDLLVGFPDFLAFVAAFNTNQGDPGYNADADLNFDGTVGFPDFLQFVAVFNKDYNTSSGKPVIAFDYGQDLNAKFNLFGRFVEDAEERTLAVDVRLLEVSDIQGYGIELQYDPNALEFVSATDQGDTFLNTADQAAQLFGVLDHNSETGQLYIASSMATGASVSGGGTLATLTFKLIDPNPGNADINIAQGILFTPDQNANMAVNLGDRFNIMPTDYALDHNFPNPFNPETTIRYAIPEAGKVTLAVYNVLGQEVTRLVDADLLPGFYTVSWNGKDALGRGVASGIYLYRIQADNFTQTHKMLLLK